MFLLELLVLVSIPAIYVAGAVFFAGPAISRRWLYVILMLATLYLLYAAVFMFIPVAQHGYYIDATVSPNGGSEYITKTSDGRVEPSLLRTYMAPIAVFSPLAFLHFGWPCVFFAASGQKQPLSSAVVIQTATKPVDIMRI